MVRVTTIYPGTLIKIHPSGSESLNTKKLDKDFPVTGKRRNIENVLNYYPPTHTL